jgi:hypothetical protein
MSMMELDEKIPGTSNVPGTLKIGRVGRGRIDRFIVQ